VVRSASMHRVATALRARMQPQVPPRAQRVLWAITKDSRHEAPATRALLASTNQRLAKPAVRHAPRGSIAPPPAFLPPLRARPASTPPAVPRHAPVARLAATKDPLANQAAPRVPAASTKVVITVSSFALCYLCSPRCALSLKSYCIFFLGSAGETACLACPAGHSCKTGAIAASVCLKGSYSAASASACTSCAAGRLQASNAATSCDLCSAGDYCASTGLHSATGSCSSGTYSNAGKNKIDSWFTSSRTNTNHALDCLALYSLPLTSITHH
jgi:hypothetical protein